MKKNVNTSELVINYLASCGKMEVATLDMVKAVVPGCQGEKDLDEAFECILPVLTNLESAGMVRLSAEVIESTGFVPKVIFILPRMKKTADRLIGGKNSGSQAGPGRKSSPEKGTKAAAGDGEGRPRGKAGKEDAVCARFNAFTDLFEKKRKLVRIRGEWQRLIASMVYSDIEEETGFNACVKSFVNGLIWQKRLEQTRPPNGPAVKAEADEPEMQPEIVRQIDEIIRASEEKNGALKEGRRGRRVTGDADAPLVRLDREEIRDYMRCLHNMRDGIQPGRLWRTAVSRFMNELLEHMPVYEACMESFRAGIVWEKNRKKLEGMD